LCFVVVTGLQWRLLPQSFPAWQTVYYHFRRWSRQDHWRRIYHILRPLVRTKMQRHKHASAACLDSQLFGQPERENQPQRRSARL
jgi:putative transposase